MSAPIDLMEAAVREGVAANIPDPNKLSVQEVQGVALVSLAISLKRIADALATRPPSESGVR